MGILCIRRTLTGGWRSGFITGLGIASADGIYGAIAAFGLTLITTILISLRPVIGLLGGAFLIYLGWTTVRASLAPTVRASFAPRPPLDSDAPAPVTLARGYISALLLTLTNPMTIMAFVAIFAGAGLAGSAAGDPLCALSIVAGFVIGSSLWWLALTTAVSLLRERLTPGALLWVNRASGLLLAAFGAVAVAAALM
jgi:threonine/homoserine/homoserine lactone efflux protein